MPLPDPIREVLMALRPRFTAPTWRKLMTLLTGTLLARGRRTVTAALRASGNAQAGNWSLFRPCAQPSSLVTAFGEPPTAPVDRRDIGASRSLCGPGHRRNAGAALGQQDQFLCVLATTPQASERLGKQHKTIGMWAHQMISLVGRWLPDRRQTADGRYGLQRPAIERSTPLLFALSSLVTLFARAMHPDGHIPVRVSAWYRKQSATFCDVLALLRGHLWGLSTFSTSPTDPGVLFVPRSTLERLSWAVC